LELIANVLEKLCQQTLSSALGVSSRPLSNRLVLLSKTSSGRVVMLELAAFSRLGCMKLSTNVYLIGCFYWSQIVAMSIIVMHFGHFKYCFYCFRRNRLVALLAPLFTQARV